MDQAHILRQQDSHTLWFAVAVFDDLLDVADEHAHGVARPRVPPHHGCHQLHNGKAVPKKTDFTSVEEEPGSYVRIFQSNIVQFPSPPAESY